MPSSRKRKLHLATKLPSDTLGRILDRLNSVEQQLELMSDAVIELDRYVSERLLEQVSEIGLQTLFILRNIPIRRKIAASSLLVTGEPDRVELTTLNQVYAEQRDAFLKLLQEERAMAQAAASTHEQNLSTGPDGEASTDDAGAADASPLVTKH